MGAVFATMKATIRFNLIEIRTSIPVISKTGERMEVLILIRLPYDFIDFFTLLDVVKYDKIFSDFKGSTADRNIR